MSWLARAPVRPHPAGFERTHFDAKGCHFLGERLGEAPDRPLGGVVSSAAGTGQAAAYGRYLKNPAALYAFA